MLIEFADDKRNVRQRGIGERAFHHRLAVVEFAVNRHGADVVLERGHQLALAFADFVQSETAR